MGIATLVIEVVDTERDLRHEFRFARSPVRLGRSTLNDLPLDRNFVSNCHGVIHFDDRRCEFVDLGSTNGTLLDGQRVAKNEAVRIQPHSVISIGMLELRLKQLTSAAREPNTHASYAFRASRLDQVSAAEAARPIQSRPPPAASVPVSNTLSDRVAPLYAQYRQGWIALLGELEKSVAPHARTSTAAQLLERYPDLAQEAEFRRWAGTDSVVSVRMGVSSPSAPPPASFALSSDPAQASRAAQLIEYFAKAFLELRRGQRQFAKDLALAEGDKSRISEIDDARSLIAYLLDPAGTVDRLDELSRAYADIMLHQVALLNGVAAGARELLEQLSPVAIARRHSGPGQFVLRFFGRDARWRTLRQRFEDLQEETTLVAVLLGRAFGRAYASSMGQSGSPTTGSTLTGQGSGTQPSRDTDRL